MAEEKRQAFDQEAMDRITDRVLGFRPKKDKEEGKEEDGKPTPRSSPRK